MGRLKYLIKVTGFNGELKKELSEYGEVVEARKYGAAYLLYPKDNLTSGELNRIRSMPHVDTIDFLLSDKEERVLR